jgi:hypothetical protein
MKMRNPDIQKLTNEKYSFIYSQGCMAGGFDQNDCIAEHFTVKTDNGAFAGIWNARYGWGRWYSTDGASQRYDREFWDAIFGEGKTTIGRANADSKEDNLYRIRQSCMRWCYYELNLFGDPSLDLITHNKNKDDEPEEDGNMDVSFYWSDDTLIGVDEKVANNSIALVEIDQLDRYKNYSWYITIDDGINFIKGPVWWFTVEAYDWDINRDGRVDDIDSEILIHYYGDSGNPGWIRADIVRDGHIDILDISTFVQHYGESYFIDFIMNDAENTLTVKDVHQDNLKWSDLEILGEANIDGLGTYVSIGDQITGCNGTITIIYKPVETVSWTFIFTDSSSAGSLLIDEEETLPIQLYGSDVNDDGVIDDSDVDLVTDHYGETGEPGWIPEDLNEDGVVDFSDIRSLIVDYGDEPDYEESDEEDVEEENDEEIQPEVANNVEEDQNELIEEVEETEEESDTTTEDVLEDSASELDSSSNIIVKSVEIEGSQVSLVSTDDDPIPNYLWDTEKDIYVPVTHAPGELKDVEYDEEEETVTVTIKVVKANWIYIEMEDLYPDIDELTVTTSDGRIISPDRIWRENGTIYVLDDPDVEYVFIYDYSKPIAGFASGSNPVNNVIFNPLSMLIVIVSLLLALLVVIRDRRKHRRF